MRSAFRIEPIGWVRADRREAIDDDWDSIVAAIELDGAKFDASALAGLSDFSHIEILYLFDKVAPDAVEHGARHPRGRTDWPKVGIFAQRARNRPNRIGATIARLQGVEGLTLRLAGLDAIDGTPVIDIKPVMQGFLPRGLVLEPAWANEIMRSYWKASDD